jgi:mannose-1-phosphate guanylyltransferase/phosphomannomutase
VTNPLEFGVVVTDESGRITRFLEKPSWGEVFSDTINTGIYVLEPGILDRMSAAASTTSPRISSPRCCATARSSAATSSTRTGPTSATSSSTSRPTTTRSRQGRARVRRRPRSRRASGPARGLRIDPSASSRADRARARRAHHAGATIVGPTTIGDRSIVERGATHRRSVLWEDVYVGEEAALNDCTVADRNTIERNATVSESTVIGRGCTIGSRRDRQRAT